MPKKESLYSNVNIGGLTKGDYKFTLSNVKKQMQLGELY